MKTKVIYLMICVMAMLASCSQSAQDALRKECEAANKELPANLGAGMSINSVKYVNDEVVYEVSFNEDTLPLSNPEVFDLVQENMRSTVNDSTDPDMLKMVDLCRQAGAKIVFVYNSNQGNSYRFDIPL